MHHVIVERWSRGRSFLHARDPRAKLFALLAFLAGIATMPPGASTSFLFYALLLVAGILLARLPILSVLLRCAIVVPFSATFAAVSLLTGDSERALALVEKSYLSALAVMMLVGTTPLPNLLAALDSLRVPRLLILIVQFLYRYLFVISEQAQHMRLAAACRSGCGRRKRRRSLFHAAAGALSVLFARSYMRAEGIQRAMLSRGFQGHFSLSKSRRFTSGDMAFLLAAILMAAVVRLADSRIFPV